MLTMHFMSTNYPCTHRLVIPCSYSVCAKRCIHHFFSHLSTASELSRFIRTSASMAGFRGGSRNEEKGGHTVACRR